MHLGVIKKQNNFTLFLRHNADMTLTKCNQDVATVQQHAGDAEARYSLSSATFFSCDKDRAWGQSNIVIEMCLVIHTNQSECSGFPPDAGGVKHWRLLMLVITMQEEEEKEGEE